MSPKKSTSKTSAKKNPSDKRSKLATAISPSELPKPIRDYWERLDWGGLSDFFGDRTLQRGRQYASSGHVRSLWATEDGKNLLATVSGTHDYTTLVTLEESGRKKQLALSTTCSCPVGSDCKHGVATIVRFLDLLASDQSIPICRKCGDEDVWEICSEKSKSKTLKIVFDEYEEDDDDFWDEDEDSEDDWDKDEPPRSSRRIHQVVSTRSSPRKDDLALSLEDKLKSKSQTDLIALILRLFKDYDAVREHFKQEAFAESVAKSGNIAKLVEKAIKLIDKGVGSFSFDYYGRVSGRPALDLDHVVEIVRQFGKFDDALAAVDRVARHLLVKGARYVEETHAEDTYEIDLVFQEMAKTLIASKTPPVSIILWAHDISGVGEYDLAGYALKTTVLERDWPVKVWSGVADALLGRMHENISENRNYWSLRTIVETLDKAHRQNEATDLLRAEAVHALELELLVDRLIKFGILDEAKKIATEQRQLELKNEEQPGYYRGDSWSDRLKTIAEKKKDWTTKASIEATEFFEHPWIETIQALLQTAKKMKIEPMIRRSLEDFLQIGKFPNAVQKSLDGLKLTAKDRRDWPIPFFDFRPDRKEIQSRFDVLCDWAIAEKRPNDVVRWFDEYFKQKKKVREFDREKVADAIADSHPDRAFRLYRDLAEHEMEATRNYPSAIRLLRKARKALAASGRGGDWPKEMEEIRTTHRRKSSLLKQLAELEAGSIVSQKRRGK